MDTLVGSDGRKPECSDVAVGLDRTTRETTGGLKNKLEVVGGVPVAEIVEVVPVVRGT